MLTFLNCVSLCIFALATYLIWWNRKNVFNHFFIGFCVIGYIVPSLVFNLNEFASNDIIEIYVAINALGALSYAVGLLIGNRWRRLALVNTVMNFSVLENEDFSDEFVNKLFKTAVTFYVISLIVMAASFAVMGFIPMFADDPFSAKQFKGVYQASYQRTAFFYRTAKQYIELLMPFLIINLYSKRKMLMLYLVLAGLALITVTLSRSAMFKGILWVLAIVASLKFSKKSFAFYLIVLVLIFSVGSSFWAIIAYFFPTSAFSERVNGDTIGEIIAFGSPDITDQLQLLSAFINSKSPNTYGLTFFGGLIPFNFKWNPSVWTLTVLNETNDISEIVSGGLRAPVSMWGYFSFGWIGVILVPFTSGFFQGYIIRKIRRIVDNMSATYNDYQRFYFLVFLYLNIGFVFMNFYELSIYYLPAFIFYGLLIRYLKKRARIAY